MKTNKKNFMNFKNSNFKITNNFKYFVIAPIAIIVIGIVLLLTVGFNQGIDFTGGTVFNVVLGDELSTEAGYTSAKNKITQVLTENGLSVSMFQKTESNTGELSVTFRYQDKSGLSDEEMNDLNAEVKDDLYIKFGLDPEDSTDSAKIQDSQRIGATVKSELLTNAFLAILIVIVVILIYIAIRFEFTSGLAAILALFHDIAVMASLVMIFRIEINSSFIAALITIIGYSINNTILIFDRIREISKSELYQKASNYVIADKSIKDTLTRSIYTAVTTLATLVALAIFGVDSIREFTIPIIFGLIAGTYSSIFIAPGLWAMSFRRVVKKNKKEKEPLVEEV